MKTLPPLFLFAFSLILLTGCGGPSTSELRAELQMVESEMMQLQMIANDARSRMSQAEWQSFFGGFAAGYGAMSGDGQMTFTGGNAVAGATGDYDRANFNLQQVQSRYNQLSQRRFEILRQLQ